MDQIDKLIATTSSFIASVKAVTPKERAQQPLAHFGQYYNALQQQTLAAFPEWEDVMPPNVKTQAAAQRGQEGYTLATYLDIMTYAQAIYQLLTRHRSSL